MNILEHAKSELKHIHIDLDLDKDTYAYKLGQDTYNIIEYISDQKHSYQRRRNTPSFSYGDISRVLRSPRRAEGGQYFC